MKTRMSYSLLACLVLCLTQVAHAEPYGRFHYPPPGYQVHALPAQRHIIVAPGGGRYFYSRGVWYAPHGPNFVVVRPPIGLFVPVLPPFYTSIWFGPTRYFVADDSYYVWRAQQHAYQVVEPPEQSWGSTASTNNDIFMYPKNGQSSDQQAKDRFECHSWAKGETQFDPTAPGGGVPDEQNASKRNDYQRAMSACLEGRGYSVK